MPVLKDMMQHLKKTYTMSSYQHKTQSFDTSFPCWYKNCSHRDLHLPYASKRSWMMRHLIKHDLRYFKDVDVDTLIPIDR